MAFLSPNPSDGEIGVPTVPGTAVTAGDINLTCITVAETSKLRVSRPRNMSTPDGIVPALLMHFEASSICADADAEPVRHMSKCKRWFHLIDVPVRQGLSPDSVLAEGNRIVELAFANLAVDKARRSASTKDREPHRVHAPQRTAGSIGAVA